MPILIDGWNLIRNRASRIREDECDALGAAAELIGLLTAFQRTHRDPITVVFDSRNEYLGFRHTNTPALRVVAARNADAHIKRQIDAVPERQRRNLRVVSSDNAIYFHAKDAYATPLRSEEFWAKLAPRRTGRDDDDGRDKAACLDDDTGDAEGCPP